MSINFFSLEITPFRKSINQITVFTSFPRVHVWYCNKNLFHWGSLFVCTAFYCKESYDIFKSIATRTL